jgi:hypothetical protein
MKDIGEKLMMMWILMPDKCFKIGVERSLRFRFTADRQVNLFELMKFARKEWGFGKDMIFTDSNLKVFDNYDLAWDKRRDIWINRYCYEQQPKADEIIDSKIVIEWNEVEIVIDRKIYTLWTIEAFNRYLSMLTGFKRKEFFAWISGAEWKDKYSINERCPKYIKAISKVDIKVFELMNLVDSRALNIHSLVFNHNGMKFCLTCPRNLALRKAIVTWNLLGFEFPGFDYITVAGRKLIQQEYNELPVDFWS